jgi:hypothetical protein
MRLLPLQKRFLAVELEFAEGGSPGLPAKAVELPPVDANDITQVTFPAEDGAKDSVEVVELKVIGHRDEPHYHGTHLPEKGSQDQALEGKCFGRFGHPPTLLAVASTPGGLTLSDTISPQLAERLRDVA